MTTEMEELRRTVEPVMIDFHRIVGEAARGMTLETLTAVAPLFERAAMRVVAQARAEALRFALGNDNQAVYEEMIRAKAELAAAKARAGEPWGCLECRMGFHMHADGCSRKGESMSERSAK